MISGGGTGGHVFPAIAIADALREAVPDAQFQFVGALGKLEMEKVPMAGYPISGLWISGIHRRQLVRNLSFPFKLLSSLWRSWRLVRRFKPDVAIGVGGYASGPLLAVTTRMGIPALLQEQNSFPGITNKLLASRADKICVAYENMERYFPEEKLVFTGNPVRTAFLTQTVELQAAYDHFGLDPRKKTLFLFGGSQGAQTLNEAVAGQIDCLLGRDDIQLIWQVGKLYEERYAQQEKFNRPSIRKLAFVDRMDMAYALADLVICRAGALTISELALLGKPAVLVPSPNVAEDHQTKNAQALTAKEAAILLPDAEARERLIPESLSLLEQPEKLDRMARNIRAFGKPYAAREIAEEVLKLVNKA